MEDENECPVCNCPITEAVRCWYCECEICYECSTEHNGETVCSNGCKE